MVGRNGRGATTLLRALAGRLVPGARLAGTVAAGAAPLLGLTSSELAEVVDGSHLAELPADAIGPLLRSADPDLVAALGIGAAAHGPTVQDRAALRLVRALNTPDARVVLLDQPLFDLAPERRAAAAAAIRAQAAAGAVVVWADHLVEEAISSCDQVLELIGPDRAQLTSRGEWRPRTVPAPPAMALARGLDLPRAVWTASETELAQVHLTAAVPHLRTPRRPFGDRLVAAAPEITRIDRPIELRDGECLGVVSVSGDRTAEVDLARRLVAVARGDEFLAERLVLPRASRVAALMTGWERWHRLARGSVAAYVEPLAHVAEDRSVDRHSPGERAALTWALAASRPGARLLIEPTRGLDPAARRHVARTLHDDHRAMTCLVSSDVEVLTRACHRLVLVNGGTVVADGAPLAVLAQLPNPPQLVRLGTRALHVADLTRAAVTR